MTKESRPQTVEKRDQPASFRYVLISSSMSEKPFWHERQLTVEEVISKDNKEGNLR